MRERQLFCLDSPSDDCAGETEYRMALSASGRSYPRCEFHWNKRLELQDQIAERYPFHAPSDFDPSYAGEYWDDDY